MPIWKSLLVLATLVFSGRTLQAQVPAPEPSPAVLERCLLTTPSSTWTILKLSPDQLRRMGFVQDACKEECDAAGMKKDPNAISNANGATVLSEVKNILTEEQYAAWVATCADGAGGAPK